MPQGNNDEGLGNNLDRLARWCAAQVPLSTIGLHAVEAKARLEELTRERDIAELDKCRRGDRIEALLRTQADDRKRIGELEARFLRLADDEHLSCGVRNFARASLSKHLSDGPTKTVAASALSQRQ